MNKLSTAAVPFAILLGLSVPIFFTPTKFMQQVTADMNRKEISSPSITESASFASGNGGDHRFTDSIDFSSHDEVQYFANRGSERLLNLFK